MTKLRKEIEYILCEFGSLDLKKKQVDMILNAVYEDLCIHKTDYHGRPSYFEDIFRDWAKKNGIKK